MMRFCSLGSGSTGNATLVEACSGTTRTRVLIDCGYSLRETEQRLARAGIESASLDAIFVTHEHGDHVGCALALSRRSGAALWMSRGTAVAIGAAGNTEAIGVDEAPGRPAPAWRAGSERLRLARDGDTISVGDLQLRPYTVPHDAREPLQLCLSDGARKLGVLTDAGIATTHLLQQLQGCDALLLECNHDRALLAASSYPAPLKARIAGRLGRLANDTSADILAACRHPRLRHVVAAHLSERNNSPALARAALAPVLGTTGDDVVVADPVLGFGWLDLQG